MPETRVRKRQSSGSMCVGECKKLNRVRARTSYLLFHQLYDFLKDRPSAADVLRKMYDILDARRGFGSVRNATYAAESLGLVLRDNGQVLSEQERLANDESQATAKAPDSVPEEGVGNFVLGECFCDVKCRHGHEVRLFNIGRDHFVACDTCRTYMHVGSNLMSSWRQEDEGTWQRNREKVRGYRLSA